MSAKAWLLLAALVTGCTDSQGPQAPDGMKAPTGFKSPAEFIERMKDTPRQKRMLWREANVLHDILSYPPITPEAVAERYKALTIASLCVVSAYPGSKGEKRAEDIERLTLDTPEELATYAKFTAAIRPIHFELPTEAECDAQAEALN